MAQVHTEYDSNGLSACEQEQIARQIFYPKSGYEMHVSNLGYKYIYFHFECYEFIVLFVVQDKQKRRASV